ncbi:hypothetical protein SAMN04488696_0826 [Methanolobus profundi]|uniref:Uncharacterized protein n=1 Tax=Methanolobus profundi TaxID=487685 RepID=A0A1I4PQH7_9EURY|nr:hypothetical protein SAMN04488696_0826 [Methanolobus profundi]
MGSFVFNNCELTDLIMFARMHELMQDRFKYVIKGRKMSHFIYSIYFLLISPKYGVIEVQSSI